MITSSLYCAKAAMAGHEKGVIKKEHAIILQPENPAYETKIFVGEEIASVHIRGRLMKLEKRF